MVLTPSVYKRSKRSGKVKRTLVRRKQPTADADQRQQPTTGTVSPLQHHIGSTPQSTPQLAATGATTAGGKSHSPILSNTKLSSVKVSTGTGAAGGGGATPGRPQRAGSQHLNPLLPSPAMSALTSASSIGSLFHVPFRHTVPVNVSASNDVFDGSGSGGRVIPLYFSLPLTGGYALSVELPPSLAEEYRIEKLSFTGVCLSSELSIDTTVAVEYSRYCLGAYVPAGANTATTIGNNEARRPCPVSFHLDIFPSLTGVKKNARDGTTTAGAQSRKGRKESHPRRISSFVEKQEGNGDDANATAGSGVDFVLVGYKTENKRWEPLEAGLVAPPQKGETAGKKGNKKPGKGLKNEREQSKNPAGRDAREAPVPTLVISGALHLQPPSFEDRMLGLSTSSSRGRQKRGRHDDDEEEEEEPVQLTAENFSSIRFAAEVRCCCDLCFSSPGTGSSTSAVVASSLLGAAPVHQALRDLLQEGGQTGRCPQQPTTTTTTTRLPSIPEDAAWEADHTAEFGMYGKYSTQNHGSCSANTPGTAIISSGGEEELEAPQLLPLYIIGGDDES